MCLIQEIYRWWVAMHTMMGGCCAPTSGVMAVLVPCLGRLVECAPALGDLMI
jgi:hypothetical protein